MMLEKKMFISTLVAITVLGFSSINVFASTTGSTNTTTGSTKTTTEFDVTTDGKLSIGSVPTGLSFSSTVDAIASKPDTTANLATINPQVNTTDDLGYGQATNWTLSVKPTDLTYTDNANTQHNLVVNSVTVNGQSTTGLDEITVATGTNEGTTNTTIDSSKTYITLARDTHVYAHTYTGTITWTLTDTGTTTSPAS